MHSQTRIEVAAAVLQEDEEARALLLQGLEAHNQFLQAMELLQEPEQFLLHRFEWSRWEDDLRGCLDRFGLVFFKACQRRLRANSGDVGESFETARAGAPLPLSSRANAHTFEDAAFECLKVEGEPDEVVGRAELDELVEPQSLDVAAQRRAVESVEEDEVEAAPVEAPRAVITADVLARLQNKFNSRAMGAESPESPPDVDIRSVTQEMRSRCQNLMDGFEANGGYRRSLLIEQLREAASRKFLALIVNTNAELQKVFVEFLAALARLFQVRHPSDAHQIKDVFGKLSGFVADGHLEFVHGLAKAHEPRHGTWRQDAQRLRRKLKALVANEADESLDPGTGQKLVERLIRDCGNDDKGFQRRLEALLERGLVADTRVLRLLAPKYKALMTPALKSLRSKVKAQRRVDEEEAGAEGDVSGDQAVLPGDWPFFQLTCGKKAVLIGSEGKDHQLEGIQEAFGFSSLDWVDGCRNIRRFQALLDGILSGDDRIFIVMHRYTSHTVSDAIWARRDDVMVVGVEKGFGVHSVRQAIEHYGHNHLG